MSAPSHAAPYDPLLCQLADYASQPAPAFSSTARATAALCLMDALACLVPALDDPDCRRLVGPLVPGAVLPHGARVPGTAHELDPVRAAFSTSALIRWLDFSDTTYNGGHPSDNLGAILACADYRDRNGVPVTMADVLDAIVIAYEIQGRLADAVKFDAPAVGLDAVLAVKIASAAAATRLLGGATEVIRDAISAAFVDGPTLNVHRHPPNSGTRKGWAGARASATGVDLALLALRGECGYPTALTNQPWGFHAVFLDGKAITLRDPLACGIVEHVIFKLLPCQRNGTTAVEAALQLHASCGDGLARIREIVVHTHAEALERIDNATALHNAAARDHSLQFMVAAALVHGGLTAAHYHEPLANDARVLDLVGRVRLVEEPEYTAAYRDPAQRATVNAIEVTFDDGRCSDRVEVRYPGGHPRRRSALKPLLDAKFEAGPAPLFDDARRAKLNALFFDAPRLATLRAADFMNLLVAPAD
jgi:2-methylcitrate dehydratase